jgi:serine/threonine-protein kinase
MVNDYLRRRFAAEARSMARVRHPNVVEVYAFGHVGQIPYFVMEYVEGTDLASWRRAQPQPLTVDQVVGVMEPLCRGVQVLHEAGAIHRDLKPGNVLIGPAFRVAVADLGLCRKMGDSDPTASQSIAGTPAYMSPELILGETHDPALAPRIDVYALGVIACELLTGALPVRGPSSIAMLQAQVYDEPTPPSQLRPDLPSYYDDVILAALCKDPRERIGSAKEFRRALLQAQSRHHSRPIRVIVAEDDPAHRELVSHLLRNAFANAEIIEASDGEEALQRTRAMRPDVIVTDLYMPVLDGIRLVAALRGDPATENVPVVTVTGIGGAPDWKVLRELGADGFLVKPIDRDALVSLVRRLAAREPAAPLWMEYGDDAGSAPLVECGFG